MSTFIFPSFLATSTFGNLVRATSLTQLLTVISRHSRSALPWDHW